MGAGGGVIINMSVWESVETLAAYAYGADAHRGAAAAAGVVRADDARVPGRCGGYRAGTSRPCARPRTGLTTCARTARPRTRSRSGSTSRRRARATATAIREPGGLGLPGLAGLAAASAARAASRSVETQEIRQRSLASFSSRAVQSVKPPSPTSCQSPSASDVDPDRSALVVAAGPLPVGVLVDRHPGGQRVEGRAARCRGSARAAAGSRTRCTAGRDRRAGSSSPSARRPEPQVAGEHGRLGPARSPVAGAGDEGEQPEVLEQPRRVERLAAQHPVAARQAHGGRARTAACATPPRARARWWGR